MNDSQKSKAEVLIEEFLSGNLPGELHGRVGDWIIRQREGDEGAEALQDVFDRYAVKYSRPDTRTARAWQQRCKQLGLIDRKAGRILLRKRMIRIAAVVIPLLLLAGSGLLLFDRAPDITEQTGETYASVSADEGSRKKVTLPCGSEVILKAGSEIIYNPTGFDDTRNVKLSGEAYFSVKRQEGRAFTVDASGVVITVLGTEFNVKSACDSPAEVSLFSGSVKVETPGGTSVLSPNEQFTYDKSTGVSMVRNMDGGNADRWWNNLIFEDVRLGDAFREIGGHFGVSIIMDEGFPRDKTVRAHFKGQTLPQILEILQSAKDDFSYRITPDTVYVTGK